MQNLDGKILKSYAIQERIGVGGFGAVYRAEQSSIGREVAVKVILPQHANQPDFVRRFETEAQLVARLEHPHIVPLYDYWRDPEGAYLVMRYLKGGSLRDSLEADGAWDVGRATQMLAQVASALKFAHLNDVIHRDIKTDNILLDEAGNNYLTDFGIAKDLEITEDHTGDAILGTPAYLSPEQIKGAVASIKSDVYALGILMFETITGVKPFFDTTPATVLYMQLNDPLPSVKEYIPDAPDELDVVLNRATSKDPDLRYDNALVFARDFADAVRDMLPSVPVDSVTRDIMSITMQEEELVQATNPYKGLRAFQTIDADDFHGRDELIEQLLDHIALTGQRHDFLAVVGPSGSGKSSVVKAGVLPKVANGALDQEVTWYTAEMVPGTHPVEELEAALLSVATNSQPDLYDVLRNDERGMVRAVKRIIPEDAELVLFIDQFEEVFTLVANEDERVHFLQTILNAVEDERSHIKIVITLRADFYDRPLLYGDFGKLIREHTELVLPLDEAELEEAIVAPARQARVTLERGLVSAIITDVYQQPGALPLLQYALTELFERRSGRLMTLDAYEEIGGTTGALARRAEELYQSFDDVEKDATRQMFLRLVSLGEGTEDTRRRVFQSELLSLKQNANAMPKVIKQFGKFRLLTFDHDPQTRSSTVEVAHEALIRQWDRVGEWLDENREALRLHRRLSSAADEWNQARRDPSFLARGMRLQQFETLRADDSLIVLNETETLFVSMSVEAREKRAQEEAERIRREEELEERARRRLQLFASVMSVAAIVAIGAALFAVSSQIQAQRQARIAQENAATATFAQGDAIVARDEAATSAAVAQNNEAESRALALSANARNADNSGDPQLALALALQAENVIREAGNLSNIPSEIVRTLSDIAYAPGPSARFNPHDGSVTGVAFSADSRLLASVSVDGTLVVTDTQTDEQTLSVSIDEGWFYDVAIHPGNTSVAGAASDGNVYVWAYPSGVLMFTLEDADEVHTVDYSPDGRLIASGGNSHDLLIWSAATGEMIRSIEGHTGVILNVVFSADGSRIATSAGDETLSGTDDIRDRSVRIWDVDTGEQLVSIDPNSGFVRALDFSPTGDTVAYGVWDSTLSGTVRIHDATTGEELIVFDAHTTPVTAVAYSADGAQVASIAWDRVLRVWNLDDETEIDSYVGFADRVLGMDYSNDGESLAIGVGNIGDNIYTGNDGTTDNSVWIWDVNNRQQVANFTGHNDWAWAVDVSPDSALVASGGGPLRLPDTEADDYDPDAFRDATTVYVWHPDTLAIVSSLQAHTNTVDSVRFHPAGDNRLLTSAWDGQIILWDSVSGEQLMTYAGHTGRVYMVRFVGDGRQFVSVGTNGEAFLWDTETGEQVRAFPHEDFSVNGVDVSEDGRLMATTTSSGDNNVYLWDVATGAQVRTFEGHVASVNEVRFHPSGDWLVSSAWDSSLRVWDIDTGEEVRDFSGHNGHTFGIDFTEDGAIMLTTSQDTTVRMWDWDTGEELQRFDLHTDWIQEVVFFADDQLAISAGQDETVRIWRINRTAESLEAFALDNRYIRSFTCSELDVYRLDASECSQD